MLRKACESYGRHLDGIEGVKGVKIAESEKFCRVKSTDRG